MLAVTPLRSRHKLLSPSRVLFGSGSSLASSPRLFSTAARPSFPPLRHRVFDWFKDDVVPRWRRLGWLYKGATLLAGSSVLYYVMNVRGPTATTDAIVSTFEAGGIPDWHDHFSKDLLASVKRPQLEEDLHKLLHPDTSTHYAVVIGGTGTGKSTAVRLAMRSLPDPKGIVYFLTPETLESFSTGLAAQVGYRGKELDLGGALYRWINNFTREDNPPPVQHEPLASWMPLRESLVSAADKFFVLHNRPMVLVVDAFDRVCKKNPDFALKLQEFAKDGADNGHLRVVFVFSKDEALPLLKSQSAWERALEPPFEVSGISDTQAVKFLLDHHVEQSRAQDAVRTITGGRFSLLLKFIDASAAESNDTIRQQLDTTSRIALNRAGVESSHFLFAQLYSSECIPADVAEKVLNPDQLKQLLVDNILTVHADQTYSFQTRHVSRFFKGIFDGMSNDKLHLLMHPKSERKQKQPADTFALLPDTTTMEEVLRMVAKERSYSKEQLEPTRMKLEHSLIITVGDLRVLSKERIEGLGLPPVVTEYLLRVKPADSPDNH